MVPIRYNSEIIEEKEVLMHQDHKNGKCTPEIDTETQYQHVNYDKYKTISLSHKVYQRSSIIKRLKSLYLSIYCPDFVQ